MLISQVSVCKKNNTRVNVYGDEGFLFSCGADIAVNYALTPGKNLTDKDFEEILAEDERTRAYACALIMLGRRPHSRREIALKLQKKEIGKQAIDYVIDLLLKSGLINDGEYAELYAKELSERYCKKAVYQKLLARGIDSRTALNAAESCDETPALMRAYNMAYTRFKNLPENERRLKVMRSLAAKGFEYADIRRALEGGDEN